MTTKADIDEAVRQYGSVPTSELPNRYRNPKNEHDFNIAVALQAPRINPGSGPVYDDAGNLTGWHGFKLKDSVPKASAPCVRVDCVECDRKLEIDDTEESTQEVMAALDQAGPSCYYEAQDGHDGVWQVGRVDGQWVGRCPTHRLDDDEPQPTIEKVGRNDPCLCHSGLKYKKCCGKNAPADADGNTYEGRLTWADGSQPEVGSKEGSIIVKVQTALNAPTGPALIYDRSRTFQRQVPAEQVAERMKGRPKAFFYAQIRYGQIVLGEEAPHQGW